MQKAQGKSIVKGIAIGKIKVLKAAERVIDESIHEDTDAELKRFQDAVDKVKEEQNELYEKALESTTEENAAIFQVHAMMMEDPDLLEAVTSIIEGEKRGAEYAVQHGFDNMADMFEQIDDEYLKARSADIRDLENSVLDVLLGIENEGQGTEPAILAADDLAPSETVKLDKSLILGIVTKAGSATSHTAILARSMNIPTLIQTPDFSEDWDGKEAVIDGYNSCVYIEPDEGTRTVMQERREMDLKAQAELKKLIGQPSTTKDGRKINVFANIGGPDDVQSVLDNDGEGVGLFRSEFVYLNSKDYPTEEEQFQAYKEVLEKLSPRLVIIRTCDIGADKKVDYMGLEHEDNPALGYRAIRICLTRKDFFKTQLRALLRASAYGNLGVMFPMIISKEELVKAKEIMAECRKELEAENVPMGDMQIGIMIETPASVLIADDLAEECDFFSIGTNDLIQYTTAIDRQNDKLDVFLNTHHPAVLREIQMTIEAGHRHNTWVGICGELGADLDLTETFLRMGIDELSVNPRSILPLRKTIRDLDLSK
ncbi:MAG: phosphoenolpyruvate--protein phosphotransferase [Anaerovoracaceae bacterium]|jgi:phosphotransferase system enzyme I (PtsI)